ncbi:GerAB/ArcD/ProY family transporter [Bacillus thermotolerans]|uniref:Spore germination protein GerSB n=1 Tax=Bacillus thermotolerans TaxID=1221996 RepID=A0A0F5HPT5_BACTR|nr:endospore germination permease [Bacillus thermotolerans]KKB35331.1 Spore germination protein GerSB [Bacillus thermotolerans]
MKNIKSEITLMQYILLIHGVQMGVGVLTLPRELAEKAGTDGWMVLILSWFLSTTASLIIIQVMKKHPDGTILDLLTHYFGKWVGKAAAIIFALYFAVLAHVIFAREALFIQAWILPYTEVYVLILLLSIPSYLIVRENIKILGRYAEFIFFMTLWTLITYLLPLEYAEWLHLLPVLKEGWMPILTTVRAAIFSFIGFEIAFFLYPFLQKKEKASIGIVVANTLSLIMFLIITIGAFAFYSPDEITLYNEPTIEMLKVIEFQFIERLEIVVFSFYLFVISTTVLPFMFITVFCTSWLAGKQDHRRHLIWFLLIECAVVALFPPSFDRNTLLQQTIEQAGLIVAFAFPLCLWAYVSLRGLFKRRAIK